MALWGNVDNSANSDLAAVIQYNKATTAANQTLLFGNTKAGTFVTNVAVGQFGVDTNEIRASTTGHGYHAGWVLRKEGTGLRAGRVTYETLVAMGSMSGDAEDTKFPDYRISITTQPSSANGPGNVTFTVVATSVPSTTLSYNWQRNTGGGWTNVLNTSGVWYGNTSATLTANAAIANANTLRVQVSATGATTVTSSNASVTTP